MSESGNSGNGVFWCIAAGVVLVIIGAMSGGSPSSKTPTTRSAWCREHADDPWSGEYDPVLRRYMRECT